MTLFKKTIDLSQFIANLLSYQLDSIEKNFDSMVILADEFKVLKENDKKDLYDKLQTFLAADILLGCHLNFGNKIEPEEINKCVAVMYRRCLVEYKGIQEDKAVDKAKEVLDLLGFMEEARKNHELRLESASSGSHEANKLDGDEQQKFFLADGFGTYFAGNNTKTKDFDGKHFAAFKLAKAFVKTDIVETMLKETKINFNG